MEFWDFFHKPPTPLTFYFWERISWGTYLGNSSSPSPSCKLDTVVDEDSEWLQAWPCGVWGGVGVGVQEVKLLSEISICMLSVIFMLGMNLGAGHEVPRWDFTVVNLGMNPFTEDRTHLHTHAVQDQS